MSAKKESKTKKGANTKKGETKKESESPVNESTEARQVSVSAQYVKDLSFENPKAPNSLIGNRNSPPAIDVSIDVQEKEVGEDLYEVSLVLVISAKKDDEPAFITELNYAGVFVVKGVPDNEKELVLRIFCPGLLFPFARRIIADTTRDGGFPPLMLDPIDFGRLYAQRKAATEQSKNDAA